MDILFLNKILKRLVFVQRLMKGDFVWMNPLFWPIISCAVTFVMIFFLSEISFLNMIRSFLGDWILLIVFPLIVIAILAPFAGLISNILFYQVNQKYLLRLVLTYISIMLIFCNSYYLILFFFDDGTIPFDGIMPLWKWLGGLEGRRIYLKNAFLSYVDCFHYSCVSITTLGYGDMLPTKWYTKLLTDIEVILGMGVAIVNLGRFFFELRS